MGKHILGDFLAVIFAMATCFLSEDFDYYLDRVRELERDGSIMGFPQLSCLSLKTSFEFTLISNKNFRALGLVFVDSGHYG